LLLTLIPCYTGVRETSTHYAGGVIYFALKSQLTGGGWMALSNNAFWPHQDVYLPLILKP